MMKPTEEMEINIWQRQTCQGKEGDPGKYKVWIKQNKSSIKPPFDPVPYTVMEKNVIQVTVIRGGKERKRNKGASIYYIITLGGRGVQTQMMTLMMPLEGGEGVTIKMMM